MVARQAVLRGVSPGERCFSADGFGFGLVAQLVRARA